MSTGSGQDAAPIPFNDEVECPGMVDDPAFPMERPCEWVGFVNAYFTDNAASWDCPRCGRLNPIDIEGITP